MKGVPLRVRTGGSVSAYYARFSDPDEQETRCRFRHLVSSRGGAHKGGLYWRPARTGAPALAEEMMRLLLNGEERRFAGVDHIAALVAALGLDARKVAVERNLEIVPRSAYAATGLCDGDRIEIVHFIGGG